jgi:putative ABC transport system permease protein
MSIVRRIWNAARRSRIDDELRQEMDTHLALIEEEERANAAHAADASRRARSRFGNPLVYRERAGNAVIATGLEQIVKDVGFAARRLARSPTFTLASLLTLALAVGANAAIFAVVQRVVLNSLPYPESDRVIVLDHAGALAAGAARSGAPCMTPGLYRYYADRARTLEAVGLYRTQEQTLTGNGEPERIRASRVTATLVSVLRVWPALGRWFTDAEGTPGAPQVAILSRGLWIRRYGANPAIIGRNVMLGGVATEVVGVMPGSFRFPDSRVDVWIAEQISPATPFGVFSHFGVARLRDGVSLSAARAELTGLIATLPMAYPDVPMALTFANRMKLVSTAITLKDAMVGHVARTLWVVLASVGFVLLIACANVTNLFLVRSEARQREIAIRRALGAGGFGVARYFLAESALLSAAGGATGLALAWGAVRVLVASGPGNLPRLDEIRLDAVTVAFTAVVTLITAVAFGSIPLWRGMPAAVPLHEVARASTASWARHRARHILMGSQVALALVLLVSSALMIRSFQNLRAVDPGFDATSALTFRIGLPDRDYPTRAAAVAAHSAILDRLAALPGINAVSASTCLPLADEGYCYGNMLQVRGRETPDGTLPPPAGLRAVAGGFVEAMGMRLLAGRSIDRGDVERGERVAVVNQALVNTYFPVQNPIGERIASALGLVADLDRRPDPVWLTIVGVVSNTPVLALAEANSLPLVYLPMSIAGGPDLTPLAGPNVAAMSYVVRAAGSPSGLLPAARGAIDTIDARLALAQVRTLQDTLDRASAQMAFTMVLLAIAAVVALLLGVVGIYGVMSYVVSRRTSEIGVRLALGAQPSSVAGMIVRQGGLVALGGVVIGFVIALVGGRLIESLLYGVSARDPGVFAATTLTVLTVALLACSLPARRAARLSPLEALRRE